MKALTETGLDLPWWRGAVGYEIYLRSFNDANGDGFGDLAGIIERLDYLEWLGVDVIWVTPHYPTPDHDHGYDVADYLAVDPRVGDLATFDQLIAEAHVRGLKVFTDIVPNHTSSDHQWFQAALSDPTGPYRDYYIWRHPKADGSPPNNWVSHFGGPAWTLDPKSGQYYCHLFLSEQPDLNWENDAVRAEFEEILRFWFKRGVDGFRIDVAHGLRKEPSFADNPSRRQILPTDGPTSAFGTFIHQYDLGQVSTVEIYRHWSAIANEYGGVLLGELGVWDAEQFAVFVADGTALDVCFALEPGLTPWVLDRQLGVILGMSQHAGGGVAWEVSNHDQHRAVTRFGGGDLGLRRTLALSTMFVGLDGMFFAYQGEELGLEDGRVVPGGLEDPISVRNPEAPDEGRDGSRTAMPWTDASGNGFTTAPTAWIDAADRAPAETVSIQRAEPSSHLYHYRALVGLRKRYPQLWQDPLIAVDHERFDPDSHVVTIRRENSMVVANLGTLPVAAPAGEWRVAYQSWPLHAPTGGAPPSVVPAETTIVLVRELADG